MRRGVPQALGLVVACAGFAGCDARTTPPITPIEIEAGRFSELGVLSVPALNPGGEPWDPASGPDVFAVLQSQSLAPLTQTTVALDWDDEAAVGFAPVYEEQDLKRPFVLALFDDEPDQSATPMGSSDPFTLEEVLAGTASGPEGSGFDLAVPVTGRDSARVRLFVQFLRR